MHDFPPPVSSFTGTDQQSRIGPGDDQFIDGGDTRRPGAADDAAAGHRSDSATGRRRDADSRRTRASADHPDTRSPARFLIWLLWRQGDVLLVGSIFTIAWMLPGTLGPFLIGRAVDQGIDGGSMRALLGWSGLLLAVILVAAGAGIFGHTLAVRGWLLASYRVTKMVARKNAELGHLLPQRTPTGEVLSISSSDSDQFGHLTDIVARAAGSVVTFLIIAGIVLDTSTMLGWMVLIAAPVLVGIALPLLRPLHRRQMMERNRNSKLTSMATDIVSGLRILRGVGGEKTFGENYAVQSQRVRSAGVAAGIWQAVTDATGVAFAGLFLVMLTWIGALQVLDGSLTVGELISFFGYAVFMVAPVQTFFEFAQKWVRAQVSAAKTIAVIEQDSPWSGPGSQQVLPNDAELVDEQTGFVATPGELIMVVSAQSDESAQLADRLGRYLTVDHDPVSLDVDEHLKGRAAKRVRADREGQRRRAMQSDRERASGSWGVRMGDVDLGEVDIGNVRERVLVSDTQSRVFAGTLQEAVDPHACLSRQQAERAMRTASAEDVYDAVPGGWQGVLDERGRGLSGGQRQRLVLARALAQDPEYLILVEPTSAVDAHTEAVIAERLAGHRRGRTTVVMTASPLLLRHADRVALLDGDSVIAVGTHDRLLATDTRYRQVVVRAFDEEPVTEDESSSPSSSEPDGAWDAVADLQENVWHRRGDD